MTNKKIKLTKKKKSTKILVAAVFAGATFVGLRLLNTVQPQTTQTDTQNASAVLQFPDLNGDRYVDILDLSLLLSRWKAFDTAVDVTGDNYVNIFDLSKMLSQWQQTGPAVVGFSTFQNNTGLLANELNVATNGNWTWPTAVRISGSDRFSTTMKASRIVSGRYYLSSVFGFTNYNQGGYIGMQTNLLPMVGAPRGAIFSIWDTTVAEAVDGGIAQPFGGEGVGMQTMRAMPWSTGVEYELYVERRC